MSIRQIGNQINSVVDIAVVVRYDSETREYQVESWNPSEDNIKRNIYYTDCKIDALKTRDFIVKRGI